MSGRNISFDPVGCSWMFEALATRCIEVKGHVVSRFMSQLSNLDSAAKKELEKGYETLYVYGVG